MTMIKFFLQVKRWIIDNSLKRIKDLERPAKEKRGTNTKAANKVDEVFSLDQICKKKHKFFFMM